MFVLPTPFLPHNIQTEPSENFSRICPLKASTSLRPLFTSGLRLFFIESMFTCFLGELYSIEN
jgi:hypothetical protein